MKIVFVSVENSLSAIGFRKMAALVKTIEPELGCDYTQVRNFYFNRHGLVIGGELRHF